MWQGTESLDIISQVRKKEKKKKKTIKMCQCQLVKCLEQYRVLCRLMLVVLDKMLLNQDKSILSHRLQFLSLSLIGESLRKVKKASKPVTIMMDQVKRETLMNYHTRPQRNERFTYFMAHGDYECEQYLECGGLEG